MFYIFHQGYTTTRSLSVFNVQNPNDDGIRYILLLNSFLIATLVPFITEAQKFHSTYKDIGKAST